MMRHIAWLNLAAYLGALAIAAAGMLLLTPRVEAVAAAAAPGAASPLIEALPDGRPAVRDAHGKLVPVAGWKRVVALDLVADDLVADLIEPGRIAAVSAWAQGPDAWRLSGLPRLSGLDDLEAVLRLKPDLALISTYGGESDKLQRLRDAGVAVFDLGPAGGMAELTANLRRVAALTGAAVRGERLAAQLSRRMAAVALRLPAGLPHRRALVLTPVVDQVYGGTTGSSFHDLVLAAGLDDAAEGRFAEPWPRIGAEQALAIDPDVIVTRSGAAAELRRIPGFDRLRAMHGIGGVIELPGELFDSPGLGLPDAAEALCARAYPQLFP